MNLTEPSRQHHDVDAAGMAAWTGDDPIGMLAMLLEKPSPRRTSDCWAGRRGCSAVQHIVSHEAKLIPWRRVVPRRRPRAERLAGGVRMSRSWSVGASGRSCPDMTRESGSRASGSLVLGPPDLLAEGGGVAQAVGDGGHRDAGALDSRKPPGLCSPPGRDSPRGACRMRSQAQPLEVSKVAVPAGPLALPGAWRCRSDGQRKVPTWLRQVIGHVLAVGILIRRHECHVAGHAEGLGRQLKLMLANRLPLLQVEQELVMH